VGALNGVTAVSVVGSATNPPGEGRIRQVVCVTVPNNTGAAIDINLFLHDGTNANLIDHRGGATQIAIGETYSSALRLPIILLRDYDYLEMTTTAAAVPKYYSVWTEGPADVFGTPVVG
jgi:hypothetical protein